MFDSQSFAVWFVGFAPGLGIHSSVKSPPSFSPFVFVFVLAPTLLVEPNLPWLAGLPCRVFFSQRHAQAPGHDALIRLSGAARHH